MATKYEVFLKVVELGSLTQAAEVLGYTQPGVSHVISSMEEEFGFPLLIRSRAGVRLTDGGARVMPLLRQLCAGTEQLRQIVSAVSGLEAGTVRVGTFTSVAVNWLPEMIKDFNALYPNIAFGLFSGDYHDVENWLADSAVDLSFATLPIAGAQESYPLHEDRLLAVLPKDHELADQPFFPLAELEKQPFIGLLENSSHDLRRVVKAAGVRPNIRFSIKDDYAILAMVEKGLGITIMPELFLQGRTQNVCVLPVQGNPTRQIGLALPGGAAPSPCAARFAQFVQEWVQRKYAK